MGFDVILPCVFVHIAVHKAHFGLICHQPYSCRYCCRINAYLCTVAPFFSAALRLYPERFSTVRTDPYHFLTLLTIHAFSPVTEKIPALLIIRIILYILDYISLLSIVRILVLPQFLSWWILLVNSLMEYQDSGPLYWSFMCRGGGLKRAILKSFFRGSCP
ncbi:predicted protein [Methanosarcina acetivorans C2A]|uniref:Uncharacterized protein n=1 Tax=Methanosarcina acetivorans (strain ATCC 35395 / DSM 2834 / JCM 12185 / C2A) TaxID=188937 RepID=Q8TU77_METAC|nr:predicted protein [Methanosarcina acetivorans C2A]